MHIYKHKIREPYELIYNNFQILKLLTIDKDQMELTYMRCTQNLHLSCLFVSLYNLLQNIRKISYF